MAGAVPVVAVAIALGSGRRASGAGVTVEGLTNGMAVTPARLQQPLRISVRPTGQIKNVVVLIDGGPVPHTVDGSSVVTTLPALPDGPHQLTVMVKTKQQARVDLVVDSKPPALQVPAVVDPVPIGEPYVLHGTVEAGGTVTADHATATVHDGQFELTFAGPPAAPVDVVATDQAGNRTVATTIVPVQYPGGRGVHVTASAWASSKILPRVMALIDAKKINEIELDIKDEGGEVGYHSKVDVALQAGAVKNTFDLEAAVKLLHSKGIRVVGRVVAFRDPILTKWAWDNGHHDWVIQTPAGQPLGAYGGFSNFANPEVRKYNLALAEEAARAGVDDILWDYIRRPEGKLSSMVFTGLQGSPGDSVTAFLAESHAMLRALKVYQGASVFGISATRPDQIAQPIPQFARNVDYLSPMVYPSLWNKGEYGIKDPKAAPHDIVRASLADFQKAMAGTNRPLMPWYQNFSGYGSGEVGAQVQAGKDLGIESWLLWSPTVTYTAP
ncbi:MAG: hypothetical protein JWL70_2121 [Acidimicrobiia bacterium]|nr:hypothetical protein [Acidimicrobiia bacterium]